MNQMNCTLFLWNFKTGKLQLRIYFFPDNFVQHVVSKSLKLYDISINFIAFVLIVKSVSHIYEIILVKKSLNETLKKLMAQKTVKWKDMLRGRSDDSH